MLQAIARLERLADVIATDDPWPGDLWAVALPGGNGAALSTEACVRYAEALAGFRGAVEHRRAARAHELLDRLLALFGERYARAKRELSGLDFEDLELECRELLRSDDSLRERYRERFERIMVDELQDTNRVQLELIELIANGNLFTVGDAQQSIYGFRHADVELFERLGERLAAAGVEGDARHQLPLAPGDPGRDQRRVRGAARRAVPAAARRAGRRRRRGRRRRFTRRAARRRQGRRLGDGGPRRAVAGGRGAGAGRSGSSACWPTGPRRGTRWC